MLSQAAAAYTSGISERYHGAASTSDPQESIARLGRSHPYFSPALSQLELAVLAFNGRATLRALLADSSELSSDSSAISPESSIASLKRIAGASRALKQEPPR